MNKQRHTKLLHEGHFAAEVDVELIDSSEKRPRYLDTYL